jgi:tetratricopeptide (TPR) repeat protein
MGLWSWLFPSPEQKLEKARAKLARGEFADARLDALDLGSLPGARDVVELAEEGLAKLNLEAAVAAAASGDEARTAEHLELARTFGASSGAPGMDEAVADARARITAHLDAAAAAKRKREQDDAFRIADVDPRFKEDHGEAEIPLPPGVTEEEADAVKVRLGLVHDAWPEPLRDEMIALGAGFAQAVLELDEGRPEAALAALADLPDRALVWHERARANEAMGAFDEAVAAWTRFAELAGGHHAVGEHHTGVLLARDLAQVGRLDEAVALLGALRADAPELAPGLWIELLFLAGRVDEVEPLVLGLIRTHGEHPRLVHDLARARAIRGERASAIRLLERLVQPEVDVGPVALPAHRLLATLRLEDGDASEPVLALADRARSLVTQPEWDDVYLAALAARARDDARWTDLRATLEASTPADDPRRHRLSTHLG